MRDTGIKFRGVYTKFDYLDVFWKYENYRNNNELLNNILKGVSPSGTQSHGSVEEEGVRESTTSLTLSPSSQRPVSVVTTPGAPKKKVPTEKKVLSGFATLIPYRLVMRGTTKIPAGNDSNLERALCFQTEFVVGIPPPLHSSFDIGDGDFDNVFQTKGVVRSEGMMARGSSWLIRALGDCLRI